jgi:TPR repeat protein
MAPSQEFRAQLARAKKGDMEAQDFVQECYYFGDEGVIKDIALAFKFCRMAAEAGHTMCQIRLGILYSSSEEGVECDERKASAWFLRAAEAGGDAEAQYFTAQRYRSGVGHDAPNLKEAVRWYQAAATQGHCSALCSLGVCYNIANGVFKNPGLALKLWRKCAQHYELGNAEGHEPSVASAHHAIGNCYRAGSNGLEVDMPMAMQWWPKAAEVGGKIAQWTIGEIYLMGFDEDVPVGTFDRDVPLGMKYLRALTVAERECEEDDAVISDAEALMRVFHAHKSCMGCGSPKTRKLCSGCLEFDHTKVRYCGEACQLIHWRHQTASHKAECGSRATTRDSSGVA